MSYASTRHFNLAGFAAAAVIALSLNGAVLLGFDHLASASDHNDARSATNLAKANQAAKQVTLERVVISARRA